MRMIIAHTLDELSVTRSGYGRVAQITLQIRDDGVPADGAHYHKLIIQAQQVEEGRVQLVLETPLAHTQEYVTITLKDWYRLYTAPDWSSVAWMPFVTYERETTLGKATLTQRTDPQRQAHSDYTSQDYWQARFLLPDDMILASYDEFSCDFGYKWAFCAASEWTEQIEQGEITPHILIMKEGDTFIFQTVQKDDFVSQRATMQDIAFLIERQKQEMGHSSILLHDLTTLKALLSQTKVAREHNPEGFPIR